MVIGGAYQLGERGINTQFLQIKVKNRSNSVRMKEKATYYEHWENNTSFLASILNFPTPQPPPPPHTHTLNEKKNKKNKKNKSTQRVQTSLAKVDQYPHIAHCMQTWVDKSLLW